MAYQDDEARQRAAAQVTQPVPSVQRQGNSYTATTIADRARQPGYAFAAGTYTPKPAAQVAQAAQQPAPAATTAAQVVRAGNSVSVAPRPAAAPAPSIAARVTPQSGGASGSWEAKPSAVPANVPSTSPAKDASVPNYASHPDMPTYGSDGVGKAFSAIGDGLAWLGKTAVSAPGYGFSRDSKPDDVGAGGGRGVVNPANVDPSAPRPTSTVQTPPQGKQPDPKKPDPKNPDQPKPVDAANPDAREIAPGIYRQGNSYGDSPEAAATGARPSQGPSEYNQAVATALEARDRGLPVPEVSPTLNGAPGSRRTISSAVSGGGASPSSTASATAATASRGAPSSGQQPDVMGIYARASEALKGVAEAQRALDDYGPGSGGQGGGTYIKHSGNDWETEKNLKNLRTSASSITNRPGRRGEPSVEQQAYLKALDADMAARSGNNPAAIEAMRQQGETARFNAREAGENTRAGMRNTADARRDSIAAQLAQGKLDLERTAQGYANRSADRQEKLYAEYDAAKTPEERATIAQKIRDLSGKNSQDGRYQLVRGEQVFDEKANALRNTGERLYDTQAGRFVDGGISVQAQAMPERQDQLKAGQVYETSRGPARWDGKQFTAVAG